MLMFLQVDIYIVLFLMDSVLDIEYVIAPCAAPWTCTIHRMIY